MDIYIEKVHGLQATSVSLNDRFTVLQQTGPRVTRPRRRPMSYMNRLSFKNRQLVEAIARRIEHQSKIRAFRQRLGLGHPNFGFQRYGSERSLPGLRRANSFGNLSQRSFKQGFNWGGSNGNLSRSASFGNLSWGRQRRYNPQLQQRIRNYQGRINRAYQMLQSVRGARGRGRGRGAGGGRGRGRGGILRQQNPKPVPTREELDDQLDQYMASSKAVLDKQLDEYMSHADITVDMEE